MDADFGPSILIMLGCLHIFSIMLGDGVVPVRAERHSDDQWNNIRSRFYELYQYENRPLAEVRQILGDELKFDAT